MTTGKQFGATSSMERLLSTGTVVGLTDGELLDRYTNRRGEEAETAFAAMVDRHGPMVLGVCRGLLRNPHDADDAFQAAFLVLARKAGSLRSPDLVGPWLYGVAHRAARQIMTRNQRRKKHEESAAADAGRTVAAGGREAETAAPEDVEALHDEIGRLPEKYRTAVVLCDLQGLTHEEAARRLGRPVGTISARVSRARARLKGRLSRRGVPLSVFIPAATRVAVPAPLARSTILIATAGTVPPSIAAVSQGVVTSMLLTKLKTATLILFSTAIAAGGATLAARRGEPAPPIANQREAPDDAPAPAEPPEVPRETELITRSATNLRKIAQGIHAYVDAEKRFPPPAVLGADGSPLLSWRVAILPYIGEKALHAQFRLDEPWDGPHNKALLEKLPKVYAPVASSSSKAGATYYQAFHGKGAFFENPKGLPLGPDQNPYDAISDGTVNTLMVVEAGTTVPWTKPEDLKYTPGEPAPKLGGQFKDGFTAVTADGATRFVKRSIDPKILDAMITRNGGEIIDSAEMGEGITP
ncbi:ECF RNA polymerase sigma factor SigW [Paludisphaera borealis]|uniref:ECF RNA polymerase sigma factor SigW n=2 Tax=Paludisphaera borealis TaxID=1387353 RepID=A0A1U7CXT9_9BACT|nr:ECF RNA polymerase sigma factor SigW [Paludisphaera borealis]